MVAMVNSPNNLLFGKGLSETEVVVVVEVEIMGLITLGLFLQDILIINMISIYRPFRCLGMVDKFLSKVEV